MVGELLLFSLHPEKGRLSVGLFFIFGKESNRYDFRDPRGIVFLCPSLIASFCVCGRTWMVVCFGLDFSVLFLQK